MSEYINLVPHTKNMLFSSLLVAVLCGVTLPQGFNYLRHHSFQLNIFFSANFFFHLFFIWKNKTLTYLYSRVSASHRPHASPPSLIGKLSLSSILSLFLSHWSPLLMSKPFISLFNCLFVHSHSLLMSPCFFSAYIDFGVIVLCFHSNQIWIRIKIFFSLKQNVSIKIPVIRRSKDWQKEIKQF